MGSTEPTPAVPADAEVGRLPEWAEITPARRHHMARVASLMATWAERLALPREVQTRWEAAGWLHDVLRDAEPESLRQIVPAELRDLPPSVLHGPAAAERLGETIDAELRDAIRYHTIGHPRLGALGRALYLADFLEPGRDFSPQWRAELRRRMPEDLPEVLVEVVRARIRHLLDVRKPIRPETAAFWNSAVTEAAG